jgi:hypothetical protein
MNSDMITRDRQRAGRYEVESRLTVIGLWSTSGDRTPWLMEGGKGSKPRAVHIQLRPDPLAR